MLNGSEPAYRMTQPLTIDDLLQKLNPAAAGGRHARRLAAADRGRRRHRQDGHARASRRLVDRPRRRSRPHPAPDVHPAGGGRNAAPRREHASPLEPETGSPLRRCKRARIRGARCTFRHIASGGQALGRHLSRRRHALAPPLRQGHRAAARFHDPRSGRRRGPDERRSHGAGPGQDRSAVPQEGNLHGHLQPLRQRPREARTRPGAALSLGAWNGARS